MLYLEKKKRHWHFTFTRFSTMDQKNVCWLDDCLIALKSSKNAPISKLFSFLIYDFSLQSYDRHTTMKTSDADKRSLPRLRNLFILDCPDKIHQEAEACHQGQNSEECQGGDWNRRSGMWWGGGESYFSSAEWRCFHRQQRRGCCRDHWGGARWRRGSQWAGDW